MENDLLIYTGLIFIILIGILKPLINWWHRIDERTDLQKETNRLLRIIAQNTGALPQTLDSGLQYNIENEQSVNDPEVFAKAIADKKYLDELKKDF